MRIFLKIRLILDGAIKNTAIMPIDFFGCNRFLTVAVSDQFGISEYPQFLNEDFNWNTSQLYPSCNLDLDFKVYSRLSQSITEYHRVSQSIKEYHRVLQNITYYYRLLQIIAEYYRVLQSIKEYYRVLQSITEYYRVL